MQTIDTLTPSQRFFYDNAGWSYDPKTQTKEEGRIAGALALDAAETQGLESGLYVQWEMDEEVSSADFTADNEDGGKYHSPWALWTATVYRPSDQNPEALESLGGVDFGRDGSPYGQEYARVIRAELFLEALA